MSKKLDAPLTSIQRRRRLLEKEFFEKQDFFCLEKIGWRSVDFFISTTNGKTYEVAKELLALSQVTFVGKSIGQHPIDLRVETIVKDNIQILDLIERMKAINGIKDVLWSEIVRTVRQKIPIPSHVIDQL